MVYVHLRKSQRKKDILGDTRGYHLEIRHSIKEPGAKYPKSVLLASCRYLPDLDHDQVWWQKWRDRIKHAIDVLWSMSPKFRYSNPLPELEQLETRLFYEVFTKCKQFGVTLSDWMPQYKRFADRYKVPRYRKDRQYDTFAYPPGSVSSIRTAENYPLFMMDWEIVPSPVGSCGKYKANKHKGANWTREGCFYPGDLVFEAGKSRFTLGVVEACHKGEYLVRWYYGLRARYWASQIVPFELYDPEWQAVDDDAKRIKSMETFPIPGLVEDLQHNKDKAHWGTGREIQAGSQVYVVDDSDNERKGYYAQFSGICLGYNPRFKKYLMVTDRTTRYAKANCLYYVSPVYLRPRGIFPETPLKADYTFAENYRIIHSGSGLKAIPLEYIVNNDTIGTSDNMHDEICSASSKNNLEETIQDVEPDVELDVEEREYSDDVEIVEPEDVDDEDEISDESQIIENLDDSNVDVANNILEREQRIANNLDVSVAIESSVCTTSDITSESKGTDEGNETEEDEYDEYDDDDDVDLLEDDYVEEEEEDEELSEEDYERYNLAKIQERMKAGFDAFDLEGYNDFIQGKQPGTSNKKTDIDKKIEKIENKKDNACHYSNYNVFGDDDDSDYVPYKGDEENRPVGFVGVLSYDRYKHYDDQNQDGRNPEWDRYLSDEYDDYAAPLEPEIIENPDGTIFRPLLNFGQAAKMQNDELFPAPEMYLANKFAIGHNVGYDKMHFDAEDAAERIRALLDIANRMNLNDQNDQDIFVECVDSFCADEQVLISKYIWNWSAVKFRLEGYIPVTADDVLRDNVDVQKLVATGALKVRYWDLKLIYEVLSHEEFVFTHIKPLLFMKEIPVELH